MSVRYQSRWSIPIIYGSNHKSNPVATSRFPSQYTLLSNSFHIDRKLNLSKKRRGISKHQAMKERREAS